uniref:Prefoldin subunit 1 n=1 Tax=Dunaliella tertiolecta TaxID=3047 RepID=A0A7S3RAI2_DUNTE|mmetsp:Transcript_20289/g.56533  ORF Transcript_20289/g.56533 Transcript_20289/m.56533 type:complete len:119 (+) Transcript_20289:184-540(+)|eukprot:CAMPEP_0202349850 /NCGR_PEP_ID=MMETSP1126-20121109/7165_1 /ASSEMBLY_ACC=CAM_ASM_000457 /TAXON_ID=3047 /ORGANISM="Dunaliella tertiolecta, Strain CCMP1320" /LENGTH=118 /DNA_ID=CAMNT_0048941719 /DNA_START=247 /DNA_END=603 /DNA_ORIENTATION=-
MAIEDEKAYMELHDRMLESSQALYKINTQERLKLKFKTRSELMLAELKAMPDDVRAYKSIGKAYFLAPKSEVMTEAETEISSLGSELKSLQAQRGIVQQKVKEAESEILELRRQTQKG